MPVIEEEKAEATDSEILWSDAVYEPEQELTIPYTGELEAHFMAAGQDCIFLAGFNTVHKMEIGSSDSTLFFDDFGEKGSLCLGTAKDGKVYTQIEKWGGDSRNNGIASVNLEKACLEEIYTGIVPKETIMLDIVAPGSDTDFVFWGYDGIFTYNLGDESAVNVLPAYEAPCEWEGVMNCALPDGRIVFGACTEYRVEENENGSSMIYSIPEKICFYYKSSMREK